MKIATFNCNGVRARMPVIIRWLEENKPDILGLQEIKVQTDLFPHEPFNELGYRCEVNGKKAHAGVAILSRIEPDKSFSGFRDGDEDEYPRILGVKFGNLHVINTYIPQGRDIESEQYQYKLEWFVRMREMFDDFYKTRQKVLWMGDFNVAPDPSDVYDSKRIMGHVAHNPDVSEALEKVREWGFIDLFRKFHPDEEGHYTYFDYRFRGMVEQNKGWRVDHIYVTGSLAKIAIDCYIDRDPRSWEKPSDHTFLTAEFNLQTRLNQNVST
jgi:exodeoxyribonuclease-3